MQHRSARPTQKDIALAAGVSQATVSIVLNKVETSSVPMVTRERILKLAGELGYQPNHPARILRSARTMTLACIVPDITNPFYPGLVRGLQTTAAPAGYAVLIHDTDGTPEGERRALDWLQQGRADGALAVFYHFRAPDLAEVARSLPLVLLGQPVRRGGPPIDGVFVDNLAASKAMTRWLIRRGHRRIAMIVAEYGPTRTRAEGYEAVIREAGLAPQRIVGVPALAALLEDKDRPTAVFGANDMMAIGAMQVAREMGLSIPNDIAIVGFDDIPTASLLGLTTVRQPEFDLGALAARTLMDRLQPGGMTPAAKSLELKFEIVERGSA
jgi:LacI family transcriptional regulator